MVEVITAPGVCGTTRTVAAPPGGSAAAASSTASTAPSRRVLVSPSIAPVPARPALEPEPSVAELVIAALAALALGEVARAAQLGRRLAIASADEHEPRLLRGRATAAENKRGEQCRTDGESLHCRA